MGRGRPAAVRADDAGRATGTQQPATAAADAECPKRGEGGRRDGRPTEGRGGRPQPYQNAKREEGRGGEDEIPPDDGRGEKDVQPEEDGGIPPSPDGRGS